MSKKSKISLIVLIIVIGIVLIPNLIKSEEDKAWDYSKEYVLSQLKSPSTAEFCSKEDADIFKVEYKEDVYGISAYVDSENGFGAMMRAEYDIGIMLTDDDYKVVYFEVFEAND
jgi:hypothetical protein